MTKLEFLKFVSYAFQLGSVLEVVSFCVTNFTRLKRYQKEE